MSLTFYKIHNNLVTTDKNRYLSEAGRGNGSTRSHPFQYHHPNAYTDGLKFCFFPRTIAAWNGLTTKAVSRETVDGFKSKLEWSTVGQGHGLVCLSLRTACK